VDILSKSGPIPGDNGLIGGSRQVLPSVEEKLSLKRLKKRSKKTNRYNTTSRDKTKEREEYHS